MLFEEVEIFRLGRGKALDAGAAPVFIAFVRSMLDGFSQAVHAMRLGRAIKRNGVARFARHPSARWLSSTCPRRALPWLSEARPKPVEHVIQKFAQGNFGVVLCTQADFLSHR